MTGLSGRVAASGNFVRMGAEIGRDWVNPRGCVHIRPVWTPTDASWLNAIEAHSASPSGPP